MQRLTVAVPDLSADSDAVLTPHLRAMVGVHVVDVDHVSGEVAIVYDEGWLGEAGLMGAIHQAGFTVPDLPRPSTAEA